MSSLAVVVVSWNVCDLLRSCLASLKDRLCLSGLAAEIWVVDNASTDGSPEMVRREFPEVRLLANSDNRGFAGGNNQAMREMGVDRGAGPEAVFLLNPDTMVCGSAIQTLLEWLSRNPKAALVGPKLLYADGQLQHSAFYFPGLTQLAFDLYPLPARLYGGRLNGRYRPARYQSRRPFLVDCLLGAALLLRTSAIAEVGVFDDAFHMYCEEIDWAWRFHDAGWERWCVPTAEIVHYEGQSTRQIAPRSFVDLWRSRRRLYGKHRSPAALIAATALVRVGLDHRERQAEADYRSGRIDPARRAEWLAAYREVRRIWGWRPSY